jgi:(1->4)-alpha-D-glucan 1-alpha-D-glucosylmutase
VPDFYQGTESQTLTLVDPDNRQPVDFAAAAARLAVLEGDHAATAEDTKLQVTHRLLKLRSNMPALFAHGSYVPLSVEGEQAPHLLAFMRVHEKQRMVVIVSRAHYTLTKGARVSPVGSLWGSTVIRLDDHATGAARDALTGRVIDHPGGGLGAADVLATLPFAVLVQAESPTV